MYGVEMWGIRVVDMIKKLDVFYRKCMRKIRRVFWLNYISNEKLYLRNNMVLSSSSIDVKLVFCVYF